MTIDCGDGWHRGRFAAAYVVYTMATPGGLISESRGCRTCGLRTARITDAEGVDVTDRYTRESWIPSLWTRIREDLSERVDARRRKRVELGNCTGCGKHAGAGAWGADEYWCEDCTSEMFT